MESLRKATPMTRLTSYPLGGQQYPSQTPPTLENRKSPRISSPDKPDSPELRLIDALRQKYRKIQALNIWKQNTFLRQQRKSCFQSSLTTANFDIKPRMESIQNMNEKIVQYKIFSDWDDQTSVTRQAAIAQKVLHRRKLCQAFGQWQSRYLYQIAKHIKHQQRISSSHNSRAPDLIGQLHTLVSQNAKLETQESLFCTEIDDITSVIQNNTQTMRETSEKINEALQEKMRIERMKESIEMKYTDQIASLKMKIHEADKTTKTRIEEIKQRLQVQNKAKQITSESLEESQESLRIKMKDIKDKLLKAQQIATQFRNDLYQNEILQSEMEQEMKMMIEDMRITESDCDRLQEIRENEIIHSTDNYNKIKQLYEEAVRQLSAANKTIESNSNRLAAQDADIDKLSRELSLAEGRSRAALDTFNEDIYASELQDY